MSIRKHIEAADDALRSAIIEALEKKIELTRASRIHVVML